MLFGLGREAGDQIGAEHRVGAQGANFVGKGNDVGSIVAALHALQDHVVTGLGRDVKMRHQTRLIGDQSENVGVDLSRIQRR